MHPSHRRAVCCEYCGQRYFGASLRFHQKRCGSTLKICQRCDEPMRADTMREHLFSCGHAASPACSASASSPPAHAGGGGGGGGRGTRRAAAATAASPTEADEPPALLEIGATLSDGRVRCRVCSRCFDRERIAHHQSICMRASTAGADSAGHRRHAQYKSDARKQEAGRASRMSVARRKHVRGSTPGAGSSSGGGRGAGGGGSGGGAGSGGGSGGGGGGGGSPTMNFRAMMKMPGNGRGGRASPFGMGGGRESPTFDIDQRRRPGSPGHGNLWDQTNSNETSAGNSLMLASLVRPPAHFR